MTQKDEQLNKLFFAMSDPTRRKILSLLRDAGELSVSDLAEAFEMSLNAVSKHIKTLEQAGVVVRTVKWRNHLIRPNWEQLKEGFEFFSFYHHFWNQKLDSFVKHMNKNGNKNEK